MRTISLIAAAFTVLTACETPAPNPSATLNFDYASTSLGFRNSGALASGRLLLWDQTKNELITLESEIDLPIQSNSQPVNLQAKNVSGVVISANANVPETAKAEIKSRISSELAFEVSDAVRVSNSQVLTALSTAYTKLKSSQVDEMRAWRIADATGDPDRYKFVLLVEPVLAAKEAVAVKNESGTSANLEVVDKSVGNISVNFPNDATADCQAQGGARAVCYVNARVLRVFLNSKNNLDYAPVTYSRTALATAFRNQ